MAHVINGNASWDRLSTEVQPVFPIRGSDTISFSKEHSVPTIMRPPVAPHGECNVSHSRCHHCHNLHLMCKFCTSSFHLVNSHFLSINLSISVHAIVVSVCVGKVYRNKVRFCYAVKCTIAIRWRRYANVSLPGKRFARTTCTSVEKCTLFQLNVSSMLSTRGATGYSL